MFDQDLLLSDLPSDNNEAIIKIWRNARKHYVDEFELALAELGASGAWHFKKDIRRDILFVILVYFEELNCFDGDQQLKSEIESLDAAVEMKIDRHVAKIESFVNHQRDRQKIENLKSDAADRIRTARGQRAGFARFSVEEKSVIHLHINKIREFISASSIDDLKKDRLLSAVNNLSREVDLNGTWADHFYVFMGRIGEAFGDFGEKSAPLWNETRKMIDTVWGARRREDTLALPKPDVDLLPPPSND